MNQWNLAGIYIPSEILFHPELSHKEKILFAFINNMSQTTKGCFASNKYLSDLTNIPKRSLQDSISKLKELGIFHIEYEQKKTNQVVRRIFINKRFYTKLSRYSEAGNDICDYEYDIDLDQHPPMQILHPPMQKTAHNKTSSIITNTSNEVLDYNKTIPTKKIPKIENTFLPLANQLKDIIQTKKNITITRPQLREWSKCIRQLSEQSNIPPERIKHALDWYTDNIGIMYVPVIESGKSLKEKFLKLEAALERSGDAKYEEPILKVAKRKGEKSHLEDFQMRLDLDPNDYTDEQYWQEMNEFAINKYQP